MTIDLTHWKLLPVLLVNSTMVQSTSTNDIGRDYYTIPLNLNNRSVPRCAQLMLWTGIQWVNNYNNDSESIVMTQHCQTNRI